MQGYPSPGPKPPRQRPTPVLISPRQETGATGVGIYIGAYHYARPSRNPNITGANSADSEAAYFWGVASNYVKTGGTYLVPMLDWEDTGCTNQLSCGDACRRGSTNGATPSPTTRG